MKRTLIIIGIILAALALIHFRYILIESRQSLPPDVLQGYANQAPVVLAGA